MHHFEKEEALILGLDRIVLELIYPSGRIHGLGDELIYFTALSKKVIQKVKMMLFLD